MDLATLIRVLLRQWFVVLTALVIAASAAFGAWVTADADYRTNASVMVLPPQLDSEGQPQNPYDQIAAPNNADLAQLLAIKLNGPQYRRAMGERGLSTNYLVDNGDATTPILTISVETQTAAQATQTLDALVLAVGDELQALQSRFVDEGGSLYTVDVLDRTPQPTRRYGDRTRLTLSVLILGVGAAIAVAVLADNVERALRRRWASPDDIEQDEVGGDGRGQGPGGAEPQAGPQDQADGRRSRSELGVPG